MLGWHEWNWEGSISLDCFTLSPPPLYLLEQESLPRSSSWPNCSSQLLKTRADAAVVLGNPGSSHVEDPIPAASSQLGTPSILVSTALLITRRNHRKYESRGSRDSENEMQSYACWELLALIRMCVYSIYLSLKPINKASALAITDVCRHFTRPLFWWSTSFCKIIFLSSVACVYSFGNVSEEFRTMTGEEERGRI